MAEHDTTAPVPGERTPAVPPEIPVLPLRDTVLFPNSFMPLAVARETWTGIAPEVAPSQQRALVEHRPDHV